MARLQPHTVVSTMSLLATTLSTVLSAAAPTPTQATARSSTSVTRDVAAGAVLGEIGLSDVQFRQACDLMCWGLQVALYSELAASLAEQSIEDALHEDGEKLASSVLSLLERCTPLQQALQQQSWFQDVKQRLPSVQQGQVSEADVLGHVLLQSPNLTLLCQTVGTQ